MLRRYKSGVPCGVVYLKEYKRVAGNVGHCVYISRQVKGHLAGSQERGASSFT